MRSIKMYQMVSDKCEECEFSGLCYGCSNDSWICAKYSEKFDIDESFEEILDRRIEEETEECVGYRLK